MIRKLKKIKNCHHVIVILNHNAVATCLNVFSYHLAVIKGLSCVQGEMIILLHCSKLQVQVVLVLRVRARCFDLVTSQF